MDILHPLSGQNSFPFYTKPAENSMTFKWLAIQLYWTLFENTEIFVESNVNLQMRHADKLLELFEVSSQLKYIINNNDHELPEEMVSRIIIRLGLSDKLIKKICSKYNLKTMNDCAKFFYKIHKLRASNAETIEEFITHDMVINDMAVYLKTTTNKTHQHPDIAAYNVVRRSMWRKRLLFYFNFFMNTLDLEEEKKERNTISHYIDILNKENALHVSPSKHEVKTYILKFVAATLSLNNSDTLIVAG
jgi:hypothetical protein